MASPADPRHLISSLMSPAAIQLRLAASERDAVLLELVTGLPELAQRPPLQQRLLAALREREDLHSTGIGDGIALPHARNAAAGLVTQPAIVFGRHLEGLSYSAIDGKPVRLFFLLVTTSVTQHLQILARISRLLRDTRLREALFAATQPEQVIEAVRRAELQG